MKSLVYYREGSPDPRPQFAYQHKCASGEVHSETKKGQTPVLWKALSNVNALQLRLRQISRAATTLTSYRPMIPAVSCKGRLCSLARHEVLY